MPTIRQDQAGDPIQILTEYLDRDGWGITNLTATSFRWADVTGPVYTLGSMTVTGVNFVPNALLGTIHSLKINPGFIVPGQPPYVPLEITGLNITVAQLLSASLQGEAAVYDLLADYAWTYRGSDGDDTFKGGNLADSIKLGDGNDTAYGGNGDDFLEGWAGNDKLYGGDGADLFYGNTGNDTIYGDAGNDVVYAAEDDDKVYGGSGADTLYGEAGNDLLNGGTGADTMSGGTGNDIFYVDNAADKTIEVNGQGNDKVISTVSYSLAGQYIETLDLVGTGNINATGNKLNNVLDGNNGSNILNGMAGKDTLTGKGGADRFVFDQALGASNVDTITDFHAPDDSIRIDNAVFLGLSAGNLSSAAFRANTTGNAADASDRIIYETDTGELYFDRDGSGSTYQPVLFAILSNQETISYKDFLVI
ncbi:calcium-binding protein [Oryzicola mucosus]|uniref:Calcium-binding protein n=1 Tax=Oryzicola mucosus TaxID=2767425 RepID=A0A8J6PI96_9HYPH|nr:calcium-binding protein [Oryzicola mucosus]